MSNYKKIAVNYLGFLSLVLAGLSINLIFFLRYDAAVVGKFDLAYSIYKLSSQLSIMGFHTYLLQQYPSSDDGARKSLFNTTLLFSLIHGILFSLLIYLSSEMIETLFNSRGLADYIRTIAPIFIFMNLNKILFWHLNANHRMYQFGIFQTMRGCSIFIVTIYLTYITISPEYLPLNFLISEVVLFATLIGYFAAKRWVKLAPISNIIPMYSFGIRSFLLGFINELNLKLDVLVVGFFLGDKLTGIYSLFATFGEGLYVVLGVIKNFINPRIASLREITIDEVQNIQTEFTTKTRLIVSAAALSGLAGLSIYIHFILKNDEYFSYFHVILILFAGPVLFNKVLILDQMLVYGGHPVPQSIYTATVLTANLILNFLLVPWIGLAGAATATTLSVVGGLFVFNTLVVKRYQFSIQQLF